MADRAHEARDDTTYVRVIVDNEDRCQVRAFPSLDSRRANDRDGTRQGNVTTTHFKMHLGAQSEPTPIRTGVSAGSGRALLDEKYFFGGYTRAASRRAYPHWDVAHARDTLRVP
jgi:hypothetical protein